MKGDKLERDPIRSHNLRNRQMEPVSPEKNEVTPNKKNTPKLSTSSPNSFISTSDPDESFELNDSKISDDSGCDNSAFKSSESAFELDSSTSSLDTTENATFSGKSFIFLSLLIVLPLLAYQLYSYQHSKTEIKTVPQISSEEIVTKLKADFRTQQEFSLKSIKKSINNVVNSANEPKSPSALLLVSSKGAEDTGNCFAWHLARLVYQDKSFLHIDGKKYYKQNPDEVKEVIDDEIEKSVLSTKLNVFLIQNIDYLPGKAALIFYKYCDDQNAPYKKSIVIMTISGNKIISKDSDYKQLNSIAHARLNETWVDDLSVDKFEPLYNRIAGYLGGIFEENTLPVCP